MKTTRIQVKPDENYCVLNFCPTFFCWSLWWIHLGWVTGAHQTSLLLPLQYNKRLMGWDKEGHSSITIMGKTDLTWGNWRSEKPAFSGHKGNVKYIFYKLVHESTQVYFTSISCQQHRLPLFIVGSFAGRRLTWDLPTERSKNYYNDKLKREEKKESLGVYPIHISFNIRSTDVTKKNSYIPGVMRLQEDRIWISRSWRCPPNPRCLSVPSFGLLNTFARQCCH